MSAHEFMNQELEFDLNNSYIPIEEGITCMLDERDDAYDIKKVDVVVEQSRIQGCWKCISHLETISWNKGPQILHL